MKIILRKDVQSYIIVSLTNYLQVWYTSYVMLQRDLKTCQLAIKLKSEKPVSCLVPESHNSGLISDVQILLSTLSHGTCGIKCPCLPVLHITTNTTTTTTTTTTTLSQHVIFTCQSTATETRIPNYWAMDVLPFSLQRQI